MKVILKDRVRSLGDTGELVNVSPGYARNFLFPRDLAVLADEANKKALENQKRALAKKIAEQKSAAEELAKKINGLKLELTKKVGGSGKLFGTVTTQELAKELEGKGFEVERRQIHIATPIKSTGTFEVTAKLFTGVEATFSVVVEMDAKQAEELKKKAEAAAKKKAKQAKSKTDDAEQASENAEGAASSDEAATAE